MFNYNGQNSELVHVMGNLYEARIESSFHRFYKEADDTWRVVTKEGLELTFGGISESKIAGVSGSFAWHITKVQDPNGNYISYAYTKDQNQVYPSRIEYTGNDTTGALPKYSVDFTSESRHDVSNNLIFGVAMTTARRTSEIEIRADGNLVRRYALEYTAGSLTGRSLLSSVRSYGTDDVTERPSVALEYHKGDNALDTTSELSIDASPWGIASDDLNGDGVLDLVVTRDAGTAAYVRYGLAGGGFITQRMAQLRAKAHRIREGHVARIDQIRHAYSKLPTQAKKAASQELTGRYKQLQLDQRLERLDKAVATNEQQIRQLTGQAQQALRRHALQHAPQRRHDLGRQGDVEPPGQVLHRRAPVPVPPSHRRL